MSQSTSHSAVTKKRRRTPRSWVWKWGLIKGHLWICNLCPTTNQKSFVKSSTTHIITHLREIHDKSDSSPDSTQTTLTSYRSIDKQVITQLLVDWVVQDQQPFTAIESQTFRAILQYVNPYSIQKVPKCGDTVRNHGLKMFNDAKDILITAIKNTRSRIHLSFDLWTSPNYKSLIAIIGHWTAPDLSLKTVLLAIREINGSHTGENIGGKIFEIIEEYQIAFKLGYCVLDNASNNDTALNSMSELMMETYGIPYDVSSYRLRCLGHIINLVVISLLFGNNSQRTVAYNNDVVPDDMYDGALYKLRAVIGHIRITPQRRHLYYSEHAAALGSSPDFMVVADNSTRWNSTYTMIKSALSLRVRLDGYMRYVANELKENQLSDQDWSDLTELAELLMPFEKATLAAQGNNQGQGSIVSVLLSMDMLLSRLESMKEESVRISSAFQLSIDAAWAKLDKYYGLTERSPIYVVSIILHPCMKMKYFQRHWQEHPDWIESARRQMYDYYMQYCPNNTSEAEESTNRSDIDEWCFGRVSSNESELDQYLNAPIVTLRGEENMISFSVVGWYKGNESQFPILSSIAYDIYAVPAMSAEAERVFSRYVPNHNQLIVYSKGNYNRSQKSPQLTIC
jgi:hypothetical protein